MKLYICMKNFFYFLKCAFFLYVDAKGGIPLFLILLSLSRAR